MSTEQIKPRLLGKQIQFVRNCWPALVMTAITIVVLTVFEMHRYIVAITGITLFIWSRDFYNLWIARGAQINSRLRVVQVIIGILGILITLFGLAML